MNLLKVLVVEDELGIQKSILEAYDWKTLGCEVCGAAASGIEAFEICIRHSPDIVITDIVMPGIDGLMLVKHLKQSHPDMHFILLTGHREFEYARTAVNIGADAFLVKPIQYGELGGIIQRIATEIRGKYEGRERAFQVETILRDLLNGRPYNFTLLDDALRSVIARLRPCCVAVLEWDNEVFTQMSLSAYCENTSGDGLPICVPMRERRLALLMPVNESEHWLAEARRYFDMLLKRIRRASGASASIGVSTLQQSEDTLHQGFLEGMKALGNRFFTGAGHVHAYNPGEAFQAHPDYSRLLDLSNASVDLLARVSGTDLACEAGMLFDSLLSGVGKRIELLRSTAIIVMCLAIHKTLAGDARQFSLLLAKYDNFSRAILCEDTDALKSIYVALLLDLGDYVCVRKGGNRNIVIDRALKYISEHFSQDISLGDLARSVYLSPSYLSSFIAEHTGKTFMELINEARIHQAIELLKDKDMKIGSIAKSVGYHEPQYFSRAFKQQTGMTPSEYRSLYC